MDKPFNHKAQLTQNPSCKPHEVNCMNCRIKRDSLFNDLSFEELTVLNEKRYTMSFKAGEVICKTGSRPLGLFCLTSGKVKISQWGQNGVEQIVALKKPVDFIGFRTVMLDCQSPVSAIALEDSTVCVIDKNDLYKVVQNNNKLAFKFMRYFAGEYKKAESRFVHLTHKHMRARLADTLLHLLNTFGTLDDQGTIDAALKRTELAALSNMSTANAIRFLSVFSKEHLIEIDNRKIKILNLKALENISLLGW